MPNITLDDKKTSRTEKTLTLLFGLLEMVSPKEIADRTGYTRAYIYQIKNGNFEPTKKFSRAIKKLHKKLARPNPPSPYPTYLKFRYSGEDEERRLQELREEWERMRK